MAEILDFHLFFPRLVMTIFSFLFGHPKSVSLNYLYQHFSTYVDHTAILQRTLEMTSMNQAVADRDLINLVFQQSQKERNSSSANVQFMVSLSDSILALATISIFCSHHTTAF